MLNQGEMITVFDCIINTGPFDDAWNSIFIKSAVAVTIGLVCLFIAITRKKTSKHRWKFFKAAHFLLFFGGVALLMSTPSKLSEIMDVNRFSEVLSNKQYQIAEGIVHVENEQSVNGHEKGDIIEVDGLRFEVNFFVSTRAYRQTIAHGGVLTEGTYARIYHYDGQILRIDMSRE